MSHTRTLLAVTLLIAASISLTRPLPAASPEKLRELSDAEVAKVSQAVPARTAVTPKTPRKMLVFWRCEGFFHKSIPVANKALEIMGQKTGAFEVTNVTNDYAVFTKASLQQYDVVCLNNTTRLKFDPKVTPERCEALLSFVKSGKGLVGIHAGADNFYDWPDGAEMIGTRFSGHPWHSGGTWAVRLDEPNHPLTAPFAGNGFKIKDEIYRTAPPIYSRDKELVLMSLDLSDSATGSVKGLRPTDQDTGVSWIKTVGQGRVFYSGLGHNDAIFWNVPVLEHFLLGIQFAAGDLQVSTNGK